MTHSFHKKVAFIELNLSAIITSYDYSFSSEKLSF